MKGCSHRLKTQKSWKMLCLHPFHLSFAQSVASFTIYKEVTGSQFTKTASADWNTRFHGSLHLFIKHCQQ